MSVDDLGLSCEPVFREEPAPADAENIRRIVQSSGFFSPAEIDVAVELVTERLAKGTASGYYFLFAECDRQTVGYTCYGPIAATHGSFDLYWIAVDQACRSKGLGKRLMAETERRIQAMAGRRVYIETSNRPQYASTRYFYDRCDYRLEALIKDFYAAGDDKAIYVKAVG